MCEGEINEIEKAETLKELFLMALPQEVMV